MTLTEGMKIISHRTSEERPEFHVATCEVFVQSTRRVEKMPLVFRIAPDERGIPRIHVHVAQLNRIIGASPGAMNGWLRKRGGDMRNVGRFPSSVLKELLEERRGNGVDAQGVTLEHAVVLLNNTRSRDRNRVISYLRRWLNVVQQGYLYPGSSQVGLPEGVSRLKPWDAETGEKQHKADLAQEATATLRECSERLAKLAVKALQDKRVPEGVTISLATLRYAVLRIEQNYQEEMKKQ